MTTVMIDRVHGPIDVRDIIRCSPVADIFGADVKMLKALDQSLVSWMGRVDGEVVCVWGLIPPTILSSQAHLWLLTTDKVEGHQFLFVRYSQLMVEKMLEDFEMLVGKCNVNQHKSIKWVRWLGATFGEPDGDWVPFCIRRKH